MVERMPAADDDASLPQVLTSETTDDHRVTESLSMAMPSVNESLSMSTMASVDDHAGMPTSSDHHADQQRPDLRAWKSFGNTTFMWQASFNSRRSSGLGEVHT